jgi:type I restriction enzyme S subunit
MKARRYERYPSYRASGVEWLGEVPSHWEVQPLKRACSLNDETLAESTDPDMEIQYLDIGSVEAGGRVNELQPMRFGVAPSRARRLVRAGDTVVSTVRTYLRAITHFESPPRNLVASTGFAVLRPRAAAVTSEFMAWAARSEPFIALVIAHSEGVGYPAIAPTRLAALKLAVPAIEEQHTIATFLDRETARIDALMAKNEELIRLLEEKRTALISHVVTKGLDPSVQMKDSGVPWLGEIPAHWDLIRLGWLASVGNGSTPKRGDDTFWDDGTVPWIASGQVNDYVIADAAEYISEQARRASHLSIFPIGTILVGMVGQGRTRGMSARLAIAACINQNVAGVTVSQGRLDPRYLHLFFQACYEPLRNLGRGGNQDALNCEIIGGFKVLVPTPEEQVAIARAFDAHDHALEQARSAAHRQIALLREHRQALITAAVTGQIDVREDAPA